MGWEDWSWTRHDLASTSPVASGTHSISVTSIRGPGSNQLPHSACGPGRDRWHLGLTGTLVLQNSSADDLTVNADGAIGVASVVDIEASCSATVIGSG